MGWKESRQDFTDDASVGVGDAIITSLVTIGEVIVVETEEMEDRGVELGDADAVFDRAVTELIGRTVHRFALSPPTAIQQVNPCGLLSRPAKKRFP